VYSTDAQRGSAHDHDDEILIVLHTCRQWMEEIMVPYCKANKAKLSLPDDAPVLLILDMWSVHLCEVR
jgi:hypothetical protein